MSQQAACRGSPLAGSNLSIFPARTACEGPDLIPWACRVRSFSAKKEFAALMRMMPLDVMMPTTGQLTLTLPPSAVGGKSHNPFGSLTTIAGIKDEVVVMPSLQKPKKVKRR